jgi:hypothetical protein
MAESRESDSNVELNDTRINETSSPMHSHPESNYMKKLITITKKHAILTSRGLYLL